MHKRILPGWIVVAATIVAVASPAVADFVKVGVSGQRYEWTPGTC